MRKNSSEGITCTWCNKPAEPDTKPPACKEHRNKKLDKKANEGKTLKELEGEL